MRLALLSSLVALQAGCAPSSADRSEVADGARRFRADLEAQRLQIHFALVGLAPQNATDFPEFLAEIPHADAAAPYLSKGWAVAEFDVPLAGAGAATRGEVTMFRSRADERQQALALAAGAVLAAKRAHTALDRWALQVSLLGCSHTPSLSVDEAWRAEELARAFQELSLRKSLTRDEGRSWELPRGGHAHNGMNSLRAPVATEENAHFLREAATVARVALTDLCTRLDELASAVARMGR